MTSDKQQDEANNSVGSASGSTKYVVEVMRHGGQWVRSKISHDIDRDLFRYACALGRYIGGLQGDIAAVRVLPNKNYPPLS